VRRPPIARRHLDTRILLDYLEELLDAPSRRRVEDHLGGSCASCRDRLREVAALVQTIREDRSVAPPVSVRERALAVLRTRPSLPTSVAAGWRLAALLFDSWTDPLPAATRRAIGGARWLKFGLGDYTLEIEAEPEIDDAWTLRGRLDLPDPSLHRIELEARGERLTTWPDTSGRFVIERVPPGPWSIEVLSPDQRYRLPDLSP
jgi:hypothetical protein